MNAKEASEKLNCSYALALRLIAGGFVEAEREKKEWAISEDAVKRFKQTESKRLGKLKEKYIKLYWEGLSPNLIQKRVRRDFSENGIFNTPTQNFAEDTIYESVMKDKRTQSRR